MGFLTDYQYDIFVSYAHVDDVPLPGVKEGWVTTLINCIKIKLSMELGRNDAYSLWMDCDLAKNVRLTPQIMSALNKTAIMIIILSPGYLASEWCTREKNTFLQLLQQGDSRIFIIERNFIEPATRPPEFSELIGFRFWVHDRDGMPDKILGEPEPSRDANAGEYYRKVDEVAFELKKTFYDLKAKGEKPPALPAETNEISIFLAEATDDLERERSGVKSYMAQYGINVLPNTCYSLEPKNFRRCTERDLANCAAFVQLLSGWAGKKPEDLPNGYLQLQYDVAKTAGIPIFQWRHPSLDVTAIEDENHKALLSGARVHAEALEEFKHMVRESVMKPLPEEQESRLNALVFVNMETSDRPLAEKVCRELERHGVGYILPLFSDDPAENRNDLEVNLLESNGIIIVYGCSTVAWVRRQMLECRKILAKRDKPIQAFAIFEGPPDTKCSIDLMLPHLQVLDFKKGIDESLLDKKITSFIGCLEKESA